MNEYKFKQPRNESNRDKNVEKENWSIIFGPVAVALSSIGDYQWEWRTVGTIWRLLETKERLRRGNKLKSRCSSASADFSLIARAPGNKGRVWWTTFRANWEYNFSTAPPTLPKIRSGGGKILSPFRPNQKLAGTRLFYFARKNNETKLPSLALARRPKSCVL